MFANYYGNRDVAGTLWQMARGERVPQTLLISGPEGIGKATLARRFGAEILGGAEKIELDDLSSAANADQIAEREKWTADKRNEDPLLFATHPDFVTFPPDGPLRQISIPQMRALKERAQFKPLRGARRVFLIDHIDRANEQAANSLLKTLEEPPEHLIVILTAENAYDLLPTIRSRAVTFHLTPLAEAEMQSFLAARELPSPERRMALASGSPGFAASLDLESYDRQRDAMLDLLEASAGVAPFGAWVKTAEALAVRKSERLEQHLRVLYVLLEDLVLVQHGDHPIRNRDIRKRLEPIARRVSFGWIRRAVRKTDELADLVRRNIQKSLALDAFVIEMKRATSCGV